MAADPTYPLYPVFCIVCAALMLLVLTTNFIRQSWNVGLTFLCFWLFWELLTFGIDAVVWSDNADIKLYVYCDIGGQRASEHLPSTEHIIYPVSHLQLFASIVKPACTLIITRRLYKLASLRSLEALSRKAVGLRDCIVIPRSRIVRNITIFSLSGSSVRAYLHS
jgi:hypothetical protein